MIGKCPETDRILVAQLAGGARHHAKWRELTEDEETAAVAELRALAGGVTCWPR
jgi:hypothetical protein